MRSPGELRGTSTERGASGGRWSARLTWALGRPQTLLVWPRKRLDLTWRELSVLWLLALVPSGRRGPTEALQRLWLTGDRCLPVYSVRSGLDLFLRAKRYPPGAVAIFTAVTVEDMVLVAESHGLTVLTVDLDRDTLCPDTAELGRLLTAHRGRVAFVLHAHLFGAQARLGESIRLARAHGVPFLEDCAQAFDGFSYEGHPHADLVLWSFGPLKTATALAGGIVTAHPRAAPTLTAMREAQRSDPVLRRADHLHRLLHYTCVHGLSSPPLFTLLVALLERGGADRDAFLSRQSRSFSPENLLGQLRLQPGAPLLWAMLFRQSRYRPASSHRRAAVGAQLLAAVPDECQLGTSSARHAFWLNALHFPEPSQLLTLLRAQRIDATTTSTSLSTPRRPDRDLGERGLVAALPGVVHIPTYPGMPHGERARIARAVRGALGPTAPRPSVSVQTSYAALAQSTHVHAFHPSTVEELASLVVQAQREGAALLVTGTNFSHGGHTTKHGAWKIDMSRLSGIVSYDESRQTDRSRPGPPRRPSSASSSPEPAACWSRSRASASPSAAPSPATRTGAACSTRTSGTPWWG